MTCGFYLLLENCLTACEVSFSDKCQGSLQAGFHMDGFAVNEELAVKAMAFVSSTEVYGFGDRPILEIPPTKNKRANTAILPGVIRGRT